MVTKKYLITIALSIVTVIASIAVYLSSNSSSNLQSQNERVLLTDEDIKIDVLNRSEKLAPQSLEETYDKYEVIKGFDNEYMKVYYFIKSWTSERSGNVYNTVDIYVYERNSKSESFEYSKNGGISTTAEVQKPYNELLDFVKNNNVFDYTDKQLSDMFGSASLESGYYLGQSLNSIKAGLPAVVWRHWSPNYKNLLYVYQTDNPKDLDGYRDRTFIEKGETDIALSDAVPYSYFPLFYDDFLNFDPIVFINDSEFYFIAQPNFGAEGKQTSVSKKLQNMSKEERDNLGFGVFVYNINTGSYRMIEELPVSTRKYKYITYDNGFYVYGGNLEVVKKYNSNGVFEKDIAYLNKDLEKDFAVINFTGWRGNNGKELDGKLYQIANFENTSVGDFVEGLMAPLEEIK